MKFNIVTIDYNFFKFFRKPTPQNGAEWPRYYTIDNQIIAPYLEIENDKKSTSNFKIGYKINECEYLWKKYITNNF